MFMLRCFLPAVLGLAVLPPAAAQAEETGRISGQFGGAPIDLRVSAGDEESGVYFEVSQFQGYTDVDIDILAITDGPVGREGVWLMLHFEASGNLSADEIHSGMLADATLMIVEDWPSDAMDPTRGWIAEISDFDQIEITSLSLSDEVQSVTGTVSSDHLCLHDIRNDDFLPVLDGGSPVCREGAFDFAATSGEARTASSQATTVDVDILGRIEGAVGDQSFEWLTILSAHGAGSASWERQGDQAAALRIQGHSPTSAHFLRQDVLSIEIWANTPISEGEAIPVDVEFFESTASPLVFYTSREGDGVAEAVISQLTLHDDRSEVQFEISGRLCRVEGFSAVEGDCRPFRAAGTTELLHENL